MNKVFVLFVVLLAFVGLAMAEETSRGNYVTPIDPLTEFLNTNDCFYHSHSYEEYESPLGLGADVTLYKFGDEAKVLDKVSLETKYDFGNEKVSAFAVVTCDLTKTFSFLKGGDK